MSIIQSTYQVFDEFRLRFGAVKTFKHGFFRLINKFYYFDCLHIIVLDRKNLKSFDPTKIHRLSSNIATFEDLKEMEKQGCWLVNEDKIEIFNQGDTCLLSYVDNKLAGYTWAHSNGCPELMPGLKLSMPQEYLYNFAAFTLHEYRGYSLQSFRHRELLNHHRWRDKKGLLGYVIHTNYRSKRGLDKSGYKKIGNIWLLGRKSNFYTFIGKNLRSMGIKRINSSSSARIKK